MDGLTILGNILFFVLGTCFGAALMYFGGLFIDWQQDKKALIERFNGRCPYTDKKCKDWKCDKCEVEAQERKWLEEVSQEDEENDG